MNAKAEIKVVDGNGKVQTSINLNMRVKSEDGFDVTGHLYGFLYTVLTNVETMKVFACKPIGRDTFSIPANPNAPFDFNTKILENRIPNKVITGPRPNGIVEEGEKGKYLQMHIEVE